MKFNPVIRSPPSIMSYVRESLKRQDYYVTAECFVQNCMHPYSQFNITRKIGRIIN